MKKTPLQEQNYTFKRFNLIGSLVLGALLFAVPFFFLIVMLYLAIEIRFFYKRPRSIYHFVDSYTNMISIMDSKCLLSLTGGRCYATSMMNPFLGVSGKSNTTYFIEITGEALNLFKPIISEYRDILVPWYWWKSYRREWVSTERKDIEIEFETNTVFQKKYAIKRFFSKSELKLRGFVVDKAQYLPSTFSCIKKQKELFREGEGIFNYIFTYGLLFSNGFFLCLYANMYSPDFAINDFIGLLIVYVLFLVTLKVSALFLYYAFIFCIAVSRGIKLKRIAIRCRILLQVVKHRKKKTRYYLKR